MSYALVSPVNFWAAVGLWDFNTKKMSESEKKPLLAKDSEDTETKVYVGNPCDPRGCLHRYFPVLVIMCFLSFGKNFDRLSIIDYLPVCSYYVFGT